ncbi:extensin family protein [Oricola thermophila]|uniref:Extensin family protein n=2 Tax=Oricola thermophila TaxID=2742145 RepID=A0A6N1VM14_9HYPH|nr:extensin family protein [Oricola thermophila]
MAEVPQPLPTYAQVAAASAQPTTMGVYSEPGPLPAGAVPVPSVAEPVQEAPQTAAIRPEPVTLGFPSVSLPRLDGGNSGGGMPAEEVACRKRLKRMGVSFTDLPRIRDSASCGIDWPVKVTTLGRSIKLTPAATLNCAMAEEAARWAQKDLAPAARTRYLSGVAEIRQMSSYSCRRIAGSRTFSEHSKGNALDIGAIRLKNGRVIVVHKPGLLAFRERSFLRSIRGQACDRFGTVLGPGYNRDHADHLHLDLKERSRTACH